VCSETPRRIAMWSGPRNISTAMMRSWGSRRDTFVCDEPLYAHYLLATGKKHPGAEEIIAHYETDWQKIVRWLTGPVPGEKAVFFQKHMAHHLLAPIDRAWLDQVTNCLLIRHPREVLASYLRIEEAPEPRLEDLGLPQQSEIFELARTRGVTPPVVDAKDVLEDPRGTLGLLCDAVGVQFDEAMLSWPTGIRQTDGIWAKYWYASVARSTSFERYRPKEEAVPSHLSALYQGCLEYYFHLYAHRLH
jgi:Sulfotransferase domain